MLMECVIIIIINIITFYMICFMQRFKLLSVAVIIFFALHFTTVQNK